MFVIKRGRIDLFLPLVFLIFRHLALRVLELVPRTRVESHVSL